MRICFYGLTENFHPFFIPLAKSLESLGVEGWFFNYWPGELASLNINGMAHRLVDWKPDFLSTRESISDEQFGAWMGTDPGFSNLSPSEKKRYHQSLEHLVPGFRSALELYEFDAVFFWNGFKYPDAAMISICLDAGVKTIFAENGFFSHTMQVDPIGVNASSSLSERNAEEWLSSYPQNQPEFHQFLENHGTLASSDPGTDPIVSPSVSDRITSAAQALITERGIYSKLARPGYRQQHRNKRRVKKALELRESSRGIELPEKFIFLPLQVHDDTQITIQSPWVHTMEAMVEAVINARDQLNLDLEIVVKEHPVDVGRYNYDSRLKSQVTWLWDYPLEKLLERAECVVTVNSTVGLEAVLYGKPVVTLGKAIYNVPGVVEHAASETELVAKLRDALSRPPDVDARHRFLYKLRFHDMVSASWRKPTEMGIKNAADRILFLMKDSDET